MATQSESVSSGEIKKFIDAFNAGLEKLYTEATTSLGPWKKAREEAIKITKPRIGVWPVDPAVKTIGDLFAYVFFDPDGADFRSPPWFKIRVEGSPQGSLPDAELQKQYNDWINDMNGAMPLPTSPTAPLVLDPTISAIFKSLAWPYENSWNGKFRNSDLPIKLPPSVKIIENYNEIKKPGITNPDKYSPGQYYFDVFMNVMLRPSGPLKDPNDGNAGLDAFGGNIVEGGGWENGWLKANGGSVSVSNFSADGILGATGSFGYTTFNKIIFSGNIGIGVKYKMIKLTNIDINLDDVDTEPPKSFLSLFTQYRTGPLSDFYSVEEGKIKRKDPDFDIKRGKILNPSDKEIEISDARSLTDLTGYKFVGYYEHMLLYKAFVEAGDNYKPITLPKYAPVPEQVDPPVVSTLVPTTESKLSGEFTFNVEKRNTFVVVGNQNFALKIGDLLIEGLTTSSVIDSPKTIDLGDGTVIIDDGESGEDIYSEQPFQGLEEQDLIREGVEYKESIGTEVEYKTPVTNSAPGPNEGTKASDISYSDKFNVGMSKEEWAKTGPVVDGSKVPSNLSGPPKYNQKVSINKTITTEYLPVIKKIPGYSNGIKLLAIVMTQKEGYYPGTRSYTTNNPGNIGNTDNGSNKKLLTLEDGIKLQLEYITKVVSGTHPAYPVGKVKNMKPHYSPESKFYSPGYKFLYTGKIEQYCKIYATGARTTNSYITMIVSWFRQNGYNWVQEETTIKELVDQNSSATILS